MQRLPLATLVVLLLALLARAWVRPVYVGAPEATATAPFFGMAEPFGDDLKGACDAFNTLLADSVRREGLAATGGWPVMNRTSVRPERFFDYDHHPPGVTLASARILPAKAVSVPSVAELPTCQYTLQLPPLMTRTDELLAVVSAVPIWKT